MTFLSTIPDQILNPVIVDLRQNPNHPKAIGMEVSANFDKASLIDMSVAGPLPNRVLVCATARFKLWTITNSARQQANNAVTAIDIYGNRVAVAGFNQDVVFGVPDREGFAHGLLAILHPVVASLDALPANTPLNVVYNLKGQEIGRLFLKAMIGPVIP